MVRGQKFCVEPFVAGKPQLQVLLNQLKMILTIEQQQIGYRQRPYQFHRIIRAPREIPHQLLTLPRRP